MTTAIFLVTAAVTTFGIELDTIEVFYWILVNNCNSI